MPTCSSKEQLRQSVCELVARIETKPGQRFTKHRAAIVQLQWQAYKAFITCGGGRQDARETTHGLRPAHYSLVTQQMGRPQPQHARFSASSSALSCLPAASKSSGSVHATKCFGRSMLSRSMLSCVVCSPLLTGHGDGALRPTTNAASTCCCRTSFTIGPAQDHCD
jgi:hypothetical protein